MKKILIKFLLSIAGGIISLIIFEIFLNITGIYDKKEIVFETNYRYKLDKRLIYSLKPDNVSEWETDEFHEEVFINSTGFRNRYNLKLGNYNETYRIFAIGDSWTFGHGLSDGFTYPELLENILPRDQSLEDYVVEHDFPAIGHHKMLLNARRIAGSTDGKQLILLAVESVARLQEPRLPSACQPNRTETVNDSPVDCR